MLNAAILKISMGQTNTHTHTHTHTQNDYRNPRCACAPRVNNCRSARLENELTNFNCPIKTTSMWRKQGVLECFEVDSRLCHTSCTLSGLRPTTTLSPRQARAPDTPKSQNLMPLIYLGNKTTEHNSIERRLSLPSTRARRISETSSNA